MSNMKFTPGRLIATPAAMYAASAAGINPIALLHRHLMCDWGDVSADDAAANTAAVTSRDRIVSAYQVTPAIRILIITEANRSATTILTPEDY